MSNQKVNLVEKFSRFTDYCNARSVGEANDCYVKVVKLKGAFIWHHHENEDELFLVGKGRLLMKLRDGDVTIEEADFYIVPRAGEHSPVAEQESHVGLSDPRETLYTG